MGLALYRRPPGDTLTSFSRPALQTQAASTHARRCHTAHNTTDSIREPIHACGTGAQAPACESRGQLCSGARLQAARRALRAAEQRRQPARRRARRRGGGRPGGEAAAGQAAARRARHARRSIVAQHPAPRRAASAPAPGRCRPEGRFAAHNSCPAGGTAWVRLPAQTPLLPRWARRACGSQQRPRRPHHSASGRGCGNPPITTGPGSRQPVLHHQLPAGARSAATLRRSAPHRRQHSVQQRARRQWLARPQVQREHVRVILGARGVRLPAAPARRAPDRPRAAGETPRPSDPPAERARGAARLDAPGRVTARHPAPHLGRVITA